MDNNAMEQHLRILDRCEGIKTDSTTFYVSWALKDLVKASIPEAKLCETFGLNGDPCHILSFNMPDNKSNWVVFIKQDNIKKYGHTCLMAYHLSQPIGFTETNAPGYNIMPFAEAYEILCKKSKSLLYKLSSPLSPEALVNLMLFSHNN